MIITLSPSSLLLLCLCSFFGSGLVHWCFSSPERARDSIHGDKASKGKTFFAYQNEPDEK